MQLRPAALADVDGILEIMNDAVLNTTAIYDHHVRTAEYVRQWLQQKEQAHLPVIIAHNGIAVAAYGTYGIFRPRDGYRFSVEHSIYVHKAMRGAGTGGMLMQHLIALARLQGYHTMIGGIDAANEGSYHFHLKHGFTEVGRIKEAGYKFNRWLDLVFMQLML